jgi:hypothetical protein
MSSRKALGSPTVTVPVPATAMALTFLDPSSAPVPPRPALWYWSLEMQAQGSRLSPAGPMLIAVILGSKSLRSASSISEVFMPAYRAHGTMETTSSLMSTALSSGALPWTMTMSYPANLRIEPKEPPM